MAPMEYIARNIKPKAGFFVYKDQSQIPPFQKAGEGRVQTVKNPKTGKDHITWWKIPPEQQGPNIVHVGLDDPDLHAKLIDWLVQNKIETLIFVY